MNTTLNIQCVQNKITYMWILETLGDTSLLKWKKSSIFVCPKIIYPCFNLNRFRYVDTGRKSKCLFFKNHIFLITEDEILIFSGYG